MHKTIELLARNVAEWFPAVCGFCKLLSLLVFYVLSHPPSPPALSASFHEGSNQQLATDFHIPPYGAHFLCSSTVSYKLPANL